MITPGVLRLKYALARHGRTIAVVFAVFGLLAFAGAVNGAVNPPTHEVTEQTNVQEVSTEAGLVAVVTGESALWDTGTRLEGAPFYPLEAAPDPEVRARTVVPADQSVTVAHRISLVYRATRDDQTLWQSSQVLADDERSVADGQVTVTAPLDVNAVRTRTAELNEELTGVSRVTVLVQLNVQYETDRYAGEVTKTAPLSVGGTGYWLGGDLGFDREHATPVTHEVTQPRDLGAIGGFAFVGLLAWLAGLGAVRYRNRVDAAAIKHALDRERCFEWISTGRIGQPISGQDVAMRSLEDLVDVAIDSKLRVIHDADRDLYAVFDENRLYYFDPVGDRETVNVEAVEEEANAPRRVRSDGSGDDRPAESPTADDRDAWDRLLDEPDGAPDEPD